MLVNLRFTNGGIREADIKVERFLTVKFLFRSRVVGSRLIITEGVVYSTYSTVKRAYLPTHGGRVFARSKTLLDGRLFSLRVSAYVNLMLRRLHSICI
jgi:hypothetical protein